MTMLLVTGASGFIGRAFVAAYALRFRVRTVRRSAPPASIGAADTQIIPDIGPETDWRHALEGSDVVLHLAGRAHLLRGTERNELAEFRRVNTDGTLHLARSAASAGARRFVFVSSIGVNGNETTSHAFRETDTPDPREPYAVSKWEAEQGLHEIAKASGMEVVIVRPPLVYGPNAPGNFGALVRLIRRGVPLPFGAVANRRSLVALGNLIDFLATCIVNPAAANETFLVSDGEDLSTSDLISRIAHAMGQRPRLIPVAPRLLTSVAHLSGKNDLATKLLSSLQIDIGKARRVMGWSPPLSVDDGIREALVTAH